MVERDSGGGCGVSNLPRVNTGDQPPTEEHIRVFEAWSREVGQFATWSVANVNLAVDWWNALPGNAPEKKPLPDWRVE